MEVKPDDPHGDPRPASAAARVDVRRATPADAPSIGAVFDAAARESWTFLGRTVESPMFSAGHWDELVVDHAPPHALLVATDSDHRIVGFTAVHGDEGEIYLLFVDPEHTGKGIGRVLLDAAHEILRAARHNESFLFTEERNLRARSVYAAAGYRPDGTIRESDFLGHSLREPRLVKQL